jgi:hypothetical protein
LVKDGMVVGLGRLSPIKGFGGALRTRRSSPLRAGGASSSCMTPSWLARRGTQAPVPMEVVEFGLEATQNSAPAPVCGDLQRASR